MKISRVFFALFIVLASCGNRDKLPQSSADTAPATTAAITPVTPVADPVPGKPDPAAPVRDEAPTVVEAPFAAATERAAYEAVLADLSVADEDAAQRMEAWADALAVAGGLEEAILRVEELASAAASPPSVSFALSVLYGRKGLATKQYAALEAAERKAAAAPTVVFNLAVLYGRK